MITDSETALDHGFQVPALPGHWLLTSAGFKFDLLQRLRRMLNEHGKKVFATDLNSLAVACRAADGFVPLPGLIGSPELEQWIDQCQRHDVRVLLPSRDGDFGLLLQHRSAFRAAGIEIFSAPRKTVSLCHNKIRLHSWCEQEGFAVLPRLALSEAPFAPAMARPALGAGGRGIYPLQSTQHWQAFLQRESPEDQDWLIQPWCEWPEFSIDALFAQGGHLAGAAVRERLLVRHGESWVSCVREIPELLEWAATLGRALKLWGPACIQVFWRRGQAPLLIEVNPRLGGASALSQEAGLNLIGGMLALSQGQNPQEVMTQKAKPGLMNLRYAADLFEMAPGDRP